MDENKKLSPQLVKLYKRLNALPINKNTQEHRIYLGLLRDIYKQAKQEGNSFVENKTKQVLRKYYYSK